MKEIQLELTAVDLFPSQKPQKSKRKQTDERGVDVVSKQQPQKKPWFLLTSLSCQLLSVGDVESQINGHYHYHCQTLGMSFLCTRAS